MRKRLPFSIALLLAACGGAASTSNNAAAEAAAPSAKERAAADKKKADADALNSWFEGERAIESGGTVSCFDPNLSGRQRAVAERLGGVPCKTEGKAPSATSSAATSGFSGQWKGQNDGGDGSAVIVAQPAKPGRHGIILEVAGRDGCSGQLMGEGTIRAGRLELVVPNDDGGQCKVTFTRRGQSLAVQENDCMQHHGMSCGFSGNLRYAGSANEGLEPPAGYSE